MSSARRAAQRHGPRGRDTVIAYCRPDTVDGHFFDAVTNLLLHDRDNGQHVQATIGMESGPRIAKARCEVVRMFLDHTDADWLCWLDADMVPPPDMIERLRGCVDPIDRPIVGALCFAGGRTKIVPTIYVIHNQNDDHRIESETMLSYPPDMLIEVGGTGSACVMIHRSVFTKIQTTMDEAARGKHPLPWYQDQVIDNKDWGEDLIFCLRARSVGARIWIHTGIKVGHRKKWTIDERAFLNYAARLDEVAQGPAQYTEETMPLVEIVPDMGLALDDPSGKWRMEVVP